MLGWVRVVLLSQSSKRKATYAVLFAYVVALLAMLRPHIWQIASLVERFCTSSVNVRSSHETYDMLTSWISSRGIDNASRSHLVKLNTDRGALADRTESVRRPLKYVANSGVFLFWYKGRLLRYQATQDTSGYFKENNIAITCLGRSGTILKDLFQDCQREYVCRLGNKITIHGHSGGQWTDNRKSEARPLSTVILNQREKALLVDDMKDFLNPTTRSWYTQRSLPYRRGYLLHGPPGTGKSSFSLAIAGELNMDIYVVRVPSVDDESLKCLFAELPAHCVVLLEDIDAVISAHSRESEAVHSNEQPSFGDEKKRVTLSGLLNELDGVSSAEDRVLIMTTNHEMKLDPALIRPGRIDKKVSFALADRDTVSQIYCWVFQSPSETGADAQPCGTENGLLQAQAIQFAHQVPEGVFSPAEILSFLVPYRHDPDAAHQSVETWVESRQKTGRNLS
ncbi:mitochondrial chaperone bcs1 [Penicillium frequentans]|uniref:Mitochondrial chaperone bcs1 n=1 Tax=Penicillium frequentans TaxID=3151616 RepID=A0AAD6G8V8_9EURO|nr:mitochondrial chaperone bcs1 [Penicillium glabrum]KAJ5557660.1 mitochondrial chaperone bcs1 [Penicillium glabrum]